MPYTLLTVMWLGWCTLHSALISISVTDAIQKRFPNSFRYYRFFYNLVAVVTLSPIVWYSFSLKSELFVTWSGPWRIIPILLGAVALLLFVAGARRYNFWLFIGLRQLKNENTCSVIADDCELDTGGVLSVVRHPWYSGGMLVLWARPLDKAAIITNLVLCGYFVVGAILEERKLVAQFGRQYAEYQKRVSMLFPAKWIKRTFSQRNRPELQKNCRINETDI